jgi:molybdenum cofactor guanylyltransferase
MSELIEGVILAGGTSSRMGTNKSLITFKNKTMINHVYSRLRPQVKKVWVNTNTLLEEFSIEDQFKDQFPNYDGPLVGIYTGLKLARTEWVQFCPTDSPFLPLDLVQKLFSKSVTSSGTVIVPLVKGRIEPVFSLCHKSTLEGLEAFILSGKKKITDWIEQNNFETVIFENPDEFQNINDRKDLKKINDL